jgi:tRNA-dihydrouridine synthase B
MFKLSNREIEKGLFLAPMEDITDVSFRLICKRLGADFVFTEFVNSEGLVRGSEKTHKKLEIGDEERPVGIQIYGGVLGSMLGAARIAEEQRPEVIDINCGCWVKNVVGNGAGAALLKDPELMQRLVAEVVKTVSIPVSVKTRIGWDSSNIIIEEIAKRLEDAGIAFLTVHCRTRVQGHNGDADWNWIERIKNVVKIPIVLNGGIMLPEDAVRAFRQTPADALMIARGAIGNPWIFSQAKALLNNEVPEEISFGRKICYCLEHLRLAIPIKGERRAVIEHRKFYSGYLKGLRNASHVRAELMQLVDYQAVATLLHKYIRELQEFEEQTKALHSSQEPM